jgi:predicted nuclease of predicted toxin-antitoxin system
MRFLADENLDRRIAVRLRSAGHDAASSPKGLDDEAVAELAKTQARVLLTHDRDFADSLKFPPLKFSGIVLLALHPPTLERAVKAMEHLLSKMAPESFSGKLIVVSEVDVFEISPPAA